MGQKNYESHQYFLFLFRFSTVGDSSVEKSRNLSFTWLPE